MFTYYNRAISDPLFTFWLFTHTLLLYKIDIFYGWLEMTLLVIYYPYIPKVNMLSTFTKRTFVGPSLP